MEQIISSSVLILAVILIRIIFRKRVSQKLVYALWLLVAIKLLVPINVDNSFNVMNVVQSKIKLLENIEASNTSIQEDSSKKTDGEAAKQILAPANNQPKTNLNFIGAQTQNEVIEEAQNTKVKAIISLLWVAGFCITLTVLAGSNLIFLKKSSKKRKFVGNYRNQIKVYETKEVDTPCLFGVVRPVIYIPAHMTEELSQEQIEMILTHEWTHYKHKDHIWSLIRCTCLAVYWFNPLVWIGTRLSKQDCEMACDEDVIKYIGEDKKKEYGLMLVEMCESLSQYRNQCILVQEFGRGNRNMKKRLLILGNKSKKMMISAAAVVVFAVAVTGCTLGNSKTNEAALNQSDESKAISTESEVANEGMTQVSETSNDSLVSDKEENTGNGAMHLSPSFYEENVKQACYGTGMEFMEMYVKMFSERDQAGLALMSKGVFDEELQKELDSDSFAWMEGTTAELDSESSDGSFVMKLIYDNGGSALVNVCIDTDEKGKKYFYAANVPIDGEQPHANNWLEEKIGKSSFATTQEIVDALEPENGYAYINIMGADEPVLVITEQTFNYDGKNMAIDAYPYLKNGNGMYECGSAFCSASTSTPITVTEDGRVICATHTDIENLVIAKETNGIMVLKSFNVEWGDSDDTNVYTGFVRETNSVNDSGKDVEGQEAKELFEKAFEEITDDSAIGFTLK